MGQKTIFFILFFFTWCVSGAAPQTLPKSINVVTGVPLTLPESALESMGLEPHQNTGGWGDVMSNVTMALELKKMFPEIDVRLIVTLNDDDSRSHVNRVRKFIPSVLKNASGAAYLNPDSQEPQNYQGVKIYFASVPAPLGYSQTEHLTAEQIALVKELTAHIPKADMGIQYSANNSPYSNLVVKAQTLKVYFEEYSEHLDSHQYSFFQKGSESIKLRAGPLGFGIYGFDSKEDARGSSVNQEYINSWLKKITTENLKNNFDLAFAYAGDDGLIEDYVKAVTALAKEKGRQTVVVYKGSGKIRSLDNVVLIPIGSHPRELAHALISESTYSPLVTGDGSLSSALETVAKGKAFLYEEVSWKTTPMHALIQAVFANSGIDINEAIQKTLIPQTNQLKMLKSSRANRIRTIKSALLDHQIADVWYNYFEHRKSSLSIADNTVNLFQFAEIYQSLKSAFSRNLLFSDFYLRWLIELSKTFSARKGFPFSRLSNHFDDKVYGKPKQLLEKWFVLYTFWELGHPVTKENVVRVIQETAHALRQKQTQAGYDFESELTSMMDQVNGSRKANQALRLVLETDSVAAKEFVTLEETYGKRLRTYRDSACVHFYK